MMWPVQRPASTTPAHRSRDAPPASFAAGGVSLELLRSTVPVRGLSCTQCQHDLEADLTRRVREQEQVEVIRRLRLHEIDQSTVDQLVARARSK